MTLHSALPCIAITSGEPAGIGPDLCLMLAKQYLNENIVIIGDAQMLEKRASLLNISITTLDHQQTQKNTVSILHVPCTEKTAPGILNMHNSQYVLNILTRAIDGCISGEFSAMVTAPVHKGVINDAGISFTGHTEWLAEYTNTDQVVMMLVGGGLRVALATTHLPLSQVSTAITQTTLEKTIRILYADLVAKFRIKTPRIVVSGLNPHAGEDGYLGREEITVINPVLEKLRNEGMQLTGALPADTLFTKKHLDQVDCVLAMYHDQGLPVLKHASFGTGVNVTLGLPIIRTSVDHGTALDLAGTGNIDIGSMREAFNLAKLLSSYQTDATQ